MVEKILYEKQKELLEKSHRRYCFRTGTSTGKTLIGLHHYLKFSKDKDLFIIAPAAKVHEKGWDREIEKIKKYYNIDFNYKIISYNVVFKTPLSKDYHYIIDETHFIKSPSSKRGKLLTNFLKNEEINFTFLTATPFSRWEECINYAILYGIARNKTDFYNKFLITQKKVIKNSRGFYNEITGYKNIKELEDMLSKNFSVKLTVNDIVELPNEIHKFIDFKSSPIYKQVKKSRVYNDEPLDTLIKLSTTLRQITNTKDKLEYLEYIYGKIKDTENNLLIFYNFNSELEEIQNKITVDYVINGEKKEYPEFKDFKEQKGKVTLVQIRAGGVGIELQYNNIIVFYSPTYSYQDYVQALGRAYRIGQNKKVVVFKFKTTNTIEEKIYDSLNKKEDFDLNGWSDSND